MSHSLQPDPETVDQAGSHPVPDLTPVAAPAADVPIAVPPAAVLSEEPMLDEAQQQNIVTRLNRVEGQVRGIRRMVLEPRLCVELLQQLAAAEAALNRISLTIFRYHVERCVPEGIAQGNGEQEKRLSELVDIFDRFSR